VKQRKQPHTASVLQAWVATAARQQDIVPLRLQRQISFMVISAILDRVRDENNDPLFIVKGGVAMELRLHLQARTSKDFDAVFRESFDQMLERLGEALDQPFGGFTLRRGEPEPIGPAHSLRIDLKLSYKGRSWSTVQLEVSPSEGQLAREIDRVAAFDLAPFGLEGPNDVPCVATRYQIAQKLHACTEVFDDGPENGRFRDLLDLLLLRGLVEDVALAHVRGACVEVFDVRRKHSWPPQLTVPDSWAGPFERLAKESQFAITDVEDAAARVREMIAEIDAAQ
jgi:Nucleotidyl transferase AbiEii toxin, Type IV TA system